MGDHRGKKMSEEQNKVKDVAIETKLKALTQQLELLKSKVSNEKEELFVKNIVLKDLEEMEEVADIAVNRCRNRLVNLQNRVERRREMLTKVKDKLANLEHNTIREDCENIMGILEVRKSELGQNITAMKGCQRNMDEKMEELHTNLMGQGLRILGVDKKLNEE